MFWSLARFTPGLGGSKPKGGTHGFPFYPGPMKTHGSPPLKTERVLRLQIRLVKTERISKKLFRFPRDSYPNILAEVFITEGAPKIGRLGATFFSPKT